MMKAKILTVMIVLTGIAAFHFRPQIQEVGLKAPEEPWPKLSTRSGVEASPRKLLSKREILERFPEKLPMIGGHGLIRGQEEQFKIFADLGALEGEAAVDYIFERYGTGQSAYLPMTFAMAGWMETNMEEALLAFKGFLKTRTGRHPNPGLAGGLFEWKGVSFHSGLM